MPGRAHSIVPWYLQVALSCKIGVSPPLLTLSIPVCLHQILECDRRHLSDSCVHRILDRHTQQVRQLPRRVLVLRVHAQCQLTMCSVP